MRTLRNEVATLAAVGTGLSCFALGCLDLEAPTCPAAPPADVLYVHGTIGNDGDGTGECAAPLKTITHAIAVANESNARVIHIFGNSSPIVYGTATNSERFPLRLEKNGLILEGDGEDQVILRGGSSCEPIDGTLNCAIAMVGSDVEVRGLQIENIDGAGIRSTSPALRLANLHVTNCGTVGIFLGSEMASLTQVRATNNTNDGVRAIKPLGEAYAVTIDGCVFSNNGHRGLYAQNDGKISSRESTYADNNWSGVGLFDNVAFASDGDTLTGNSDGLATAADTTDNVSVDMRKALLQGNKKHGINIQSATAFVLRDSEVLGNGLAGVQASIAGANINLGTSGEPGGNTLQSTTTPNGVGICFTGSGTMQASGNHFGTCPPSSNMDLSCSGSVDVGGTGSITTDGCVAP